MRVLLLVTLLTSVAAAAEPTVSLHDLPGTDGSWQEGVAIIPAPPDRVRGWLVSYDEWPSLFSDIDSARTIGHDHGVAVVRVHSRIAGRTMIIRQRELPNGVQYEGGAGDISTQGKIFLSDAGGGRTRVVMQSTSQVHGVLGLFATRSLKRDRAFAVMRSHFQSLYRLSRLR